MSSSLLLSLELELHKLTDQFGIKVCPIVYGFIKGAVV
jgi:hypothetical protein